MFRKCLEKFGIVSNLQEKSEKVLKESSDAKDLRELLRFAKKVKTNKAIRNHIEGVKLDQGKLSYTLLPFKALTEVVKVLEFGKLKYAKDNWQKVPNAKERYIDAAFRHLISYYEGETIDPESGLHHLAHATCCLLFVIWFDLVGRKGSL